MTALAAIAEQFAAAIDEAGYEWVDAPVLQPARVYIDQSGEDLRRRTFMFAAPDGEELCLRPEQTIPTARVFLEHGAATPANLAYRGMVFRQPPEGVDRPREYQQIGVERFGGADPLSEDVAPLALAASLVASAGVTGVTIHMGDLGLFPALVDALEASPGWR
ncbi:MAG: ATP phosphoribosyltransferase regulatory subunit, partial [Pseudomonadota bacterium]